MAADPTVLVVIASGEQNARDDETLFRFCEDLCAELAEETAISLAAKEPVDAPSAVRLAERREHSNLLFVVVGDCEHVDRSIRLLNGLSRKIPPIPVAFDHDTTTLQLRRIGAAQIVEIVLIAVRSFRAMSDGTSTSGEVIDLGARFPSNAMRRDLQPSPADNDAESEIQINRTLSAVLDWVDAAKDVLVKIWSDASGREQPVYGLSWDKLLASVERLLRIRNTPAAEADRKFEIVKAMLEDTSAQTYPLARLRQELELSDVALKLVMLVLAPELDIRFQRLFGALHDDMGRRFASVGIACAVIASATDQAAPRDIRVSLSALETLRQFRVIEGFDDSMSSADELLRIAPPVLDWLLTRKESWLTADPACEAIARSSPMEALELLPTARRSELERALRLGLKRQGDPDEFGAVLLTGSEPGWIEVEAAALAGPETRVGPPLVPMAPEALDGALRGAVRASRLLDHRLVVELVDIGGQGEAFWNALVPLLPLCRPQPYVVAENAGWLLSISTRDRIAVAPLPPPSQEHRIQAIGAALSTGSSSPVTLATELAERFRLPLKALPDVAPLAIAAATTARLAQPGNAEWEAAFRTLAASRIPQLARRVPPRPRPEGGSALDRVVLPPEQRRQLETLVSHVKVGGRVLREWNFGESLDARGVSALFSGESGTGKSTAAHAIASELGADLYAVDLSKIVSKYIGETEKNLEVTFNEAEQAGAVLLFDEADALFGKRSAVNDAHDRFANIEVAYLLQRIETFGGLAILTTNHPGNIDAAFTRRLRFMIEFPFPTAQDRLQIWNRAIPVDSPHRGADLDFTLAARRLELTGGSIRQVVLHALMAAATTREGVVRPEHLREAARTELIRLGKREKIESLSDLFSAVRDEAA